MVKQSGRGLVDMSGITRQQLKSVVKECLLEILSEGVGGSLNESRSVPKKEQGFVRRNPALDTPVAPKRKMTDSLRETIRAEAGGNPVLADILSDTASNTLPNMLEGERSKSTVPTGLTERLVAAHAPEEIFGEEVASKWADLAFMTGPRR